MRSGIKYLKCPICLEVRKVETGIASMYCHNTLMEETDEVPKETEEEEEITNLPGTKILKCPVCGAEKTVEAGIRIMYHCNTKMEEIEHTGPDKEEPEEDARQRNVKFRPRR